MDSRMFITESGKAIIINSDDFQVCSAVMLGYKMMMDAFDEMKKRDMIEAVKLIKPLANMYLDTFADHPEKVANFCYERMLTLWKEGKDLSQMEG